MSRMRLLTASGRTPDKALVQDGGRERVGQGEDGPIAVREGTSF